MPKRLEKLRAAQGALLAAYGKYLEAQTDALEFFLNSPATASAIIPPAARMPADEAEVTPLVHTGPVPEPVPLPHTGPVPEPVPLAKAGPAKTLDDVRAVCVKAGAAGKAADVKQLLANYRVARVSELKPDQYAAFIAAVEGL